MGSALFDQQAGFEFDKIDSLRGDFPDSDWTFGEVGIGPECETLEVTWPSGEVSSDNPMRVELLRATDSASAEQIATAVVEGDDSETTDEVSDGMWVTHDRWATAVSGCIVGRVESDNTDRDQTRLAVLIKKMSDRACPVISVDEAPVAARS